MRTSAVGFLLAIAGCSHPVEVAVPPGATLASVAAIVEAAGLAPAADVKRVAGDPAFVKSLALPGPIDAYLAPGEYTLEKEAGVGALLAAMAQAQQAVVAEARVGASPGLTDLQVLSIACVLERGSFDPAERALVATVQFNRLKRGWTPQDGPLPATPDCTPGLDALRAAFHPSGDALTWFHTAKGRPALDLPDDERRALQAIEQDPAPPSLTRGQHYFRSNEWQPEQFRAPLQGRGGVHVGVGSEQNYTMAGWSRPDVLVLMDFDQMIADVHGAYRVAFLSAPTPDAFVDLWSAASVKRMEKLIVDGYPDAKERAPILFAYRTARERVSTQLHDLRAHYGKTGGTAFINDEEQYQYVVALYRAGRVLRVRGDLTAKTAMRQMCAHLGKFGRVVRTLYMSNAEEYFPWGPDFRENIRCLPTDERSILLRTVRSADDYTYIVQTFDNFRSWLVDPSVLTVDAFVPPRPKRKKLVFLDVTATPPAK